MLCLCSVESVYSPTEGIKKYMKLICLNSEPRFTAKTTRLTWFETTKHTQARHENNKNKSAVLQDRNF